MENSRRSVEISEWQHFKFDFRGFESLTSTKGHYEVSPMFMCFGKQWQLVLYPGGRGTAQDGKVSVYLELCSKDCNINIDYEIKIGNVTKKGIGRAFDDETYFRGWPDFISRSAIVHPSDGFLVNGTLPIELCVKLNQPKGPVFIPENPFRQMMHKMYSDEASVDVLFEIEAEENKNDQNADKIPPSRFRAHRIVLKACAPTLAELCETFEDKTPVPITGVKPDVFRRLLDYVHGGVISEEELKANAKDLMDAAERYGVVHLKLEAEEWYIRSTTLTIDNVIDYLDYADSKNFYRLKEVAMDFIAEHQDEFLENKSTRSSGGLITEFCAAMNRKKRKMEVGESNSAEFSSSLSALRRNVQERGLDIQVDESRETLYAALTESSD